MTLEHVQLHRFEPFRELFIRAGGSIFIIFVQFAARRCRCRQWAEGSPSDSPVDSVECAVGMALTTELSLRHPHIVDIVCVSVLSSPNAIL